jgi:hypothetical protein
MSRQPPSSIYIPYSKIRATASASESCPGTLPPPKHMPSEDAGDITEFATYISRPRPGFHDSSPRCDRTIRCLLDYLIHVSHLQITLFFSWSTGLRRKHVFNINRWHHNSLPHRSHDLKHPLRLRISSLPGPHTATRI